MLMLLQEAGRKSFCEELRSDEGFLGMLMYFYSSISLENSKSDLVRILVNILSSNLWLEYNYYKIWPLA